MNKRTCSLDICDGPHFGRGYCRKHYRRFVRTGDPLGSVPRPTLMQRMMSKIAVDANGCWIWQATCDPGGYGSIRVGKSFRGAHRVMYQEKVGPIPEGLVLDHLCRVRNCVNPEHLEPVTHQTNVLRGVAPPAQQVKQTHCKRGHQTLREQRPLSGAQAVLFQVQTGLHARIPTIAQGRGGGR